MDDTRHTSTRDGSPLSSKLVWAVVILGLILTATAWRAAEKVEQQITQAQFQSDAVERSLLIRRQFETMVSALEDLASLYAVTETVTRDQFARFVAPILAREPSIKALSWNPIVKLAEREDHELTMRQSGQPGYQITHRSAHGELVRAPQRDEYVVVANIEPFAGNESALGFDVSSQITRRLALEHARDLASLSVAAPIDLVQSPEETPGALGFLPRYRSGLPASTVQERRANLEGYFVAVVDIAEYIATALSSVDTSGFELNVLSKGAGADHSQLYTSSQSADGTAEIAATLSAGIKSRPSYSTTFPWAGHDIEVRLAASDEYVTAGWKWVPLGVMLAGLALTGFAASVTGIMWGRTVRIAREVADRTREIQEANSELQAEVARRIAVEERLEDHQHELERKVDERTAELRATSAYLRTILESEPECVKIISPDGKLEDMNAAGLSMIEAESLQQVRGLDVYSLISSEYRGAFVDLNRRVIAGESCTLEFELEGLRGGKRLVETHAVPLIDPESGATRQLAITRDITAKRAFEREQAELEGQLRQKQKLESIGVMAGGIAHDFNNILQVIIGNCEAALENPVVDDSTRESIKASCSAANDAARLCDQMLTYAGRSRQNIAPVRLPELVTSMRELLNISHSKNAELEIIFEDDMRLIEGDEAQLRQVVMNLISNASEAIGTEAGQIVIRIRAVDLTADSSGDDWIGEAPPAGEYIGLVVSDTGCGMDARIKEKIFDPFFTTKFAGRGLGLSSTLGIIRGHSGFLSVASESGRGTCFTVLFPVSDLVDCPESVTTKSVPASFNETILLVDDEEQVRKIGATILERLGCRVVLAADGEQAVEYFTEHGNAIDAVLLDMAMPRMNGNETCLALRRVRPDVPVIFCSGYADDAVQADTDSGAFTGFLHKPYERGDLIRILHDAVTMSS